MSDAPVTLKRGVFLSDSSEPLSPVASAVRSLDERMESIVEKLNVTGLQAERDRREAESEKKPGSTPGAGVIKETQTKVMKLADQFRGFLTAVLLANLTPILAALHKLPDADRLFSNLSAVLRNPGILVDEFKTFVVDTKALWIRNGDEAVDGYRSLVNAIEDLVFNVTEAGRTVLLSIGKQMVDTLLGNGSPLRSALTLLIGKKRTDVAVAALSGVASNPSIPGRGLDRRVRAPSSAQMTAVFREGRRMGTTARDGTPLRVSAPPVSSSSSVLTGAAKAVLDFIAGHESRGAYDAVYPNERKPEILGWTLEEVLKWQKGRPRSSAAGRYQFVRNTLMDAIKGTGMAMTELFSPSNQDRLALWLLEKKRKFSDFLSGKITIAQMGERLAQEWASLPVLAHAANGKERGQSYYAGDGLNSALVSPEAVEGVLLSIKPSSPGTTAVSSPTATPALGTARPPSVGRGSSPTVVVAPSGSSASPPSKKKPPSAPSPQPASGYRARMGAE